MQENAEQKIGILGGSFDPVHVGHLMLACSLAEAHCLDGVLFVPANRNPLKHRDLAAGHDRIKMLDFALQGSGFSVYTGELERKPPSYMIDTVYELKDKRPASYFLLMGSDLLEDITKWKAYEELLTLAPPLVAMRNVDSFDTLLSRLSLPEKIRSLFIQGKTQAPLFDISSTYIRSRLEMGLFCGHLLQKDVYSYIKEHRIYIHTNAE